MAKKRDVGTKYRMIFVRHSMTRVFRNLLFATVIILLVWWVAPYAPGFFRPPNDIYLLWLAILFMIGMILALMFRNSGYAQAKKKYLLLKVPIFWVRIPYDLIENVRMVLFKDLYEKKKMSWAQRRFLAPYTHKTVVSVNLNNFPQNKFLLSLFLPGYLFLPKGKGKGFVVYVKDYLAFSTEVDSRLNEARTLAATGLDPSRRRNEEEVTFNGYFDLDQG